MKYFLSIIAIFKNEKHILPEWIEHYLMEGVDHFYLIDNGSSDDYQNVIVPYYTEKKIEVVVDKRSHLRESLYNSYYLEKVKFETHWVMVVDLDEFIYSRPPFKTISDYLSTISSHVAQIAVPLKMFGSSGLIHQPSGGCIDGFQKRTLYTDISTRSLTKTLISTRYLTHIGIHHSSIETNGVKSVEITSDHEPLSGHDIYIQSISEEILQNSKLHCNHYPIQSYECFRKVKMTRGDANSATQDKARDINYFNAYDSHAEQKTDQELTEKRNNLRIYYGSAESPIDVTRKVICQFLDRETGMIKIDDHVGFNQCFGDPVIGVEKYLIIRQSFSLKVYPEHDHGKIEINLN